MNYVHLTKSLGERAADGQRFHTLEVMDTADLVRVVIATDDAHWRVVTAWRVESNMTKLLIKYEAP